MSSPKRRQFEYLTTPQKPLIRKMWSSGPRTDACGTPGNTSHGEEGTLQDMRYSLGQVTMKSAHVNSR
jgi:hypothetical protein